jgi:hypothetical protein
MGRTGRIRGFTLKVVAFFSFKVAPILFFTLFFPLICVLESSSFTRLDRRKKRTATDEFPRDYKSDDSIYLDHFKVQTLVLDSFGKYTMQVESSKFTDRRADLSYIILLQLDDTKPIVLY